MSRRAGGRSWEISSLRRTDLRCGGQLGDLIGKFFITATWQARILLTLDAVDAVAGASMRAQYDRALASAEAEGASASARALGPPELPTCPHCELWPSRPIVRDFNAAASLAEVSDDDVTSVWREGVRRALRPWREGVRDRDLDAALALEPAEWNMRFQIVRRRVYAVGETPTINHHHRKRLLGMRQVGSGGQFSSFVVSNE